MRMPSIAFESNGLVGFVKQLRQNKPSGKTPTLHPQHGHTSMS